MIAFSVQLPERLRIPINIARHAGNEIMRVCSNGCARRRKKDGSVVTDADMASHELLVRELADAYPDIRVISEEGGAVPYALRKDMDRLLLVDPLDGTKQFVRGIGEFSVNIALVENGAPVWGVIHLPVMNSTYAGGPGMGAFRINPGLTVSRIHVDTGATPDALVVLKSHSIKTPLQDKWLAERSITPFRRPAVGASVKFCMVAEGTAHLAPCMHPTWEWDTAAGQALVQGSGGQVTDHQGNPLIYNKPDLLNPWYLCSSGPVAG